MRTIAVLALLTVAGCGDAPISMESRPLAGTDWISHVDGFNCERLLTFGDVGEFGSGIICVLQNNQTALQATTGTYTATGDGVHSGVLTLRPTKSSCPGTSRTPLVADYAPGTDLTVGFATGVIDYVPAPTGGSGGGGSATYGCFDAALSFTANPVTPL